VGTTTRDTGDTGDSATCDEFHGQQHARQKFPKLAG
jgi:hypothetical protein